MFYTRSGQRIKISLPGQSDMWALIGGIHFEIEAKTSNSKLSKEQKAWRNLINSLENCCFIEARDINQTIQEIKNALISKGKN